MPELLIILLVVLVIFGPKKLPGLGKQLGTGMREFKDSISGNDKDDAKPTAQALDAAPEETVDAQPVEQRQKTPGE
ncbi:twin-arginine translocase TatA/TatE family subunit [Patulibacter defluvii]|uniref:twin-arginine translocase TatA/TatE family subunit n=1 Tax=Patulibacter defluvii TaxID=3095358 RepID=UPI002A75DAAE|nr:twin-arginine translocase TatA/TatE family subunit [Patulibacter sp. DM4]